MKALERLMVISEKLTERYLKWYRQRYMPEFGDLTVNTRDLYLDKRSGLIHIYSSPNAVKIPVGTPLLCVSHTDPSTNQNAFRFQFGDSFTEIPEYLIIYFKVISRTRNAQG